jgi:alpha-ketoglutarate-dependent taurine dioxygenase
MFQVLFVLQNAPAPAGQWKDGRAEILDVDPPTSKFDLLLSIADEGKRLVVTWRYRDELFEPEIITRLAARYESLLAGIVAQPNARISSLDCLPAAERERPSMKSGPADNPFARFKMGKPKKPLSVKDLRLVRTGHLSGLPDGPLLVEAENRDVDLKEWAIGQREWLQEQLLKYGAILFRGFGISNCEEFEGFAHSQCESLYEEYGDLPRQAVGNKVYTSTPYPAEQAILFHNESSHMHCWPMKIFFCCLRAAEQGGETPLADCRRVYERLNPGLRRKLEERGVLYVRNYTPGLDVSWEEFFRTGDRQEVEAYCRRAGLEWEWKPGGGLRTRKPCRAIAQHPRTGQKLMFNQVQAHHIACLEAETRRALEQLFARADLPRNVYWGDGEEIRDEEIASLRAAYDAETVRFAWQNGDVLLLDNMLTAHGRAPYVGERRIVVVLGEVMNESELR